MPDGLKDQIPRALFSSAWIDPRGNSRMPTTQIAVTPCNTSYKVSMDTQKDYISKSVALKTNRPPPDVAKSNNTPSSSNQRCEVRVPSAPKSNV